MNALEAILDHYQLAGLYGISLLGNHGGFSGARLWRGRYHAGDFCLRAWPAGMTSERLEHIHRMMDRAAGLSFVPRVQRTRQGQTYAVVAGRCWELTNWLTGRADFHSQPSAVRLKNACAALAELHRAWVERDQPLGPCPAVLRRLECLQHWHDLVDTGWRPDFARYAEAPWQPWVLPAWDLVRAHVPSLRDRLIPYLSIPLPLQMCLCDIWHDHVLYAGDAVTGLVDYGSIKPDHVAVDLARLLGSLVSDDEPLRRAGLGAYARLMPLSAETERLIDVLDKSGTVLGAANWLMWLYHEGRTYPDSQGVAQRLARLVQRMQAVS